MGMLQSGSAEAICGFGKKANAYWLLCSFIVVTALAADLVITPVCMLIFKPFGSAPADKKAR